MEVKWIEHRYKKIHLIDYSGLILERDMLSLLNAIPTFLPNVGNEPILVLTDITGCFLTPGFIDAAKKQRLELSNKYQIKQAIVGAVGAKVILLKVFNLVFKNKITPFSNHTEALNYLTKD